MGPSGAVRVSTADPVMSPGRGAKAMRSQKKEGLMAGVREQEAIRDSCDSMDQCSGNSMTGLFVSFLSLHAAGPGVAFVLSLYFCARARHVRDADRKVG